MESLFVYLIGKLDCFGSYHKIDVLRNIWENGQKQHEIGVRTHLTLYETVPYSLL